MKQLSLLSDEALFQSLHSVVTAHRSCTADLVAHLAELDARKLHLGLGYSSLFAYCVDRLGFSEDEACRRIDAARLSRGFPKILELLASGELSLTVIGLIKPHLTKANEATLLDGVRGMSSRAAREFLAARFPQSDLPAALRKLPPPPTASVQSRGRIEPLSSDRFVLRVTVSRSVRDALEFARDLLWHRNPSDDLEAVLELAVQGLIERLERERFGRTTRPVKPRTSKRTRVANETRRTVAERDGIGCDFVGEDGHRCGSRAFLEFDHIDPVGVGSGSAAENVRLLCSPHNQFAADVFYGKEHMDRARAKARTKRRSATRSARSTLPAATRIAAQKVALAEIPPPPPPARVGKKRRSFMPAGAGAVK